MIEEWTTEIVFDLLMSQEDDHLAHEAVADAHNTELRKQLAAESDPKASGEKKLPHDWNKDLPIITHLTPSEKASGEWWRGSYDEIEGEEAIKNCDGAQMFQGKWWMPLWGCDTLEHLNDAYTAALAAERDKVILAVHAAQIANKQLAAERGNYALALQMSHIETKRANEAEQQLAAAQEKVQALVDALKLARNCDHTYTQDVLDIIDAALAKVKEAK